MNLNKVQIIGNITRKPELKVLPAGTSVLNLSVAVNEAYRGANNELIENTQFISVVVFGKTAENCAQYLVKGQQVFVEGKINNRVIEKEDGTKDYKTGIVALSVQFGSKPADPDKNYVEHDTPPKSYAKPKNAPKKTSSAIDYPDEDINPEDIPF